MHIRGILLSVSLFASLILGGCASTTVIQQAYQPQQKQQNSQDTVTATIVGNLQGNVTVVEYYDYECPHCHNQQAIMDEIVANNPNVRLVYRVYPILQDRNPTSLYAAKASLAAAMQGQFLEFHQAVMAINHAPTVQDINTVAQSMGLNMTEFQQDMNSPLVMQQIESNIASLGGLAQPTPLIFVGNRFVKAPQVFNQETSYNTLEAAIVQMGSQN